MASDINIILIRDVENLGKTSQLCTVKPGYARNFLFPKKFALPVSPGRLKEFEHQKKIIAHKLLRLRTEAEKLKSKLEQLTINITVKVSQKGKIFGSIGARTIESFLKKKGFTINHRDIKINSPIKTLGLHNIILRLETDIKATIKVEIISENTEEIEKIKNKEK